MSSSLPPLNSSLIKESIDWNDGPTYGQFFLGSYKYFSENIYSLKNYSFTNDFVRDFKLCFDRITIHDLIFIILLTILWTLARFWTTNAIFKV
jgi:hypothetical protein